MKKNQFTEEEVAKLKKLIADTPRKTHIIQVLDRSSSMYLGADITISSYNEMLQVSKQSQQEDNSVVTVTLVMFSDNVELAYKQRSLDEVQPLTRETYIPNGMTALYDAIGLSIQTARSFDSSGDTAFLLQIFTDGEENSSRTYNPARLKSMIQELQDSGKWTVTVAGPKGSIDIFAKELSIPQGNVTNFDPSSITSRNLNAQTMVSSHSHYMSARSKGVLSMTNAYSAVQPEQAEGWNGIQLNQKAAKDTGAAQSPTPSTSNDTSDYQSPSASTSSSEGWGLINSDARRGSCA